MIERMTVFPLCVVLCTLLTPLPGRAAADPLFASDEVLQVTLTGPLQVLSRDRDTQPEERPGTLSYIDDSGVERQFDVMIRPRGNSRRDRDVCTFPPLRLNFSKPDVDGTLFDKQNILKLVTHCRSPAAFQNFVLKEYLAYRILNVLTDASFKVRLLKVSYVDSDRNRDPLVRYGFVIEHKKRLAKRLGLQTSDIAAVEPGQLDPEQASIAELYQYLVSNTDYSFIRGPEGEACCHNAILLEKEGGVFLPVPYDFDRTGLVDPPNGLPDEALGQRNFRERLFRGFCYAEPVREAALDKTRASKPAIMTLIESQPDLSVSHRKRALDFVEDYFRIVDDERLRERALRCRPLP